jgi:hypothetical protein
MAVSAAGASTSVDGDDDVLGHGGGGGATDGHDTERGGHADQHQLAAQAPAGRLLVRPGRGVNVVYL